MPTFLDEVLGLGFAGYSIINDIPIPLLPSNPTESENQIKANAAYSTNPASAAGQLPSRGRRSTKVSLTTILCPNSIPLIKVLSYAWRTIALTDNIAEVPITVISAGGEGYSGFGYCDDVTVSVQTDSLATLSMNFTVFVWNDLSSPPITDRSQRALAPLSDRYKPLAFWETLFRFSGISTQAIPISWTLSLSNNWTYKSFLGGFLQAPNPSLIYPGNLDTKVDLTWLGRKNDRPRDVGAIVFQLGVDPVLSTINIDRLVRDPQRLMMGTGEPNTAVKWTSSYNAVECTPY